jgi:hypothetical protein
MAKGCSNTSLFIYLLTSYSVFVQNSILRLHYLKKSCNYSKSITAILIALSSSVTIGNAQVSDSLPGNFTIQDSAHRNLSWHCSYHRLFKHVQ